MEGERKGRGKGEEGDDFDLDPSTMNAKGKKNTFSAQQFPTISEPKLINLRPVSFLNFSLRNIFPDGSIGLLTFVNGSNKMLNDVKSGTHDPHTYTDEHHNLETKLSQKAEN